jgi:hypothetical protein
MKIKLTLGLLTLLLILSLNVCGQESKYKRFKMLILVPDTARVEDLNRAQIDSIEREYKEAYYAVRDKAETVLRNSDSKTRKKIENAIGPNEINIQNYKFYQWISNFSYYVISGHFSNYKRIEIEQTFSKIEKADLKVHSDSHDYDYILFFDDIHTTVDSNKIYLNATTCLYSASQNTLILKSLTTSGSTENFEGIWRCNSDLSCLLTTFVKSATEKVIRVIDEREKK